MIRNSFEIRAYANFPQMWPSSDAELFIRRAQFELRATQTQRVRAVRYFLQIAGIIYVCFVSFAAIAQVWINLHRQNFFYTVML